MAKSLRSKSRRKTKAIARTKKAHKEHAYLEEAVAKRAAYELTESTKVEEEQQQKEQNGQEEMDATTPATINLKTMRTADGKFPVWVNQRTQRKLSKKTKKDKKTKAAKGRR